ncbi:MAG: hypothetical protein ACKVU2_15800 [Saprospiraceae bacterium]
MEWTKTTGASENVEPLYLEALSIQKKSMGNVHPAYVESLLRLAMMCQTRGKYGKSETRRGFAATEEAFKTIGAGSKACPRVMHVATHGFFFPDTKSAVSG